MSDFEFEKDDLPRTRIKVIGVGGGGCNAIDSMIGAGLPAVEFYAINTDMQALKNSRCPNKIQIGKDIMHGMGAGGDPVKGEQAAEADRDLLEAMLEGGDMCFVAACLGGGTGTGAAPVVAQLAREMGLLTVAIVTKPFSFEGPQRRQRADLGIERLREFVDALIIVMNEKLLETVGAKTPLLEAFALVNQILAQGVQSISDLINMPGLINADFEDVRSVMGATGGAVLGVGIGKGENRAAEAVKKACSATLQEKIVIDGARSVLVNLTGGVDMTLHEVNEAASLVFESADKEANIILSAVIDDRMTDEIRVTIIATGFREDQPKVSGGMREKQILPRTNIQPGKHTKSPGASALRGEFSYSQPATREEEEDYGEPMPPSSQPKGISLPDLAHRRRELERDREREEEMREEEEYQAPAKSGSLDSWKTKYDEEDELEESGSFSAHGSDEIASSLPASEPEDELKDNLEIPAIIRRRKSFFS